MNYCRSNKKKNLHIYIWRYSKEGKLKTAYSCKSCTIMLKKYGYDNKVKTFVDGNIVNAVIENPIESLGWKIKKSLTN